MDQKSLMEVVAEINETFYDKVEYPFCILFKEFFRAKKTLPRRAIADCHLFDESTILSTPDGRLWKWNALGYYTCQECKKLKIKVKAFVRLPNYGIEGQHICERRNVDEVIRVYLAQAATQQERRNVLSERNGVAAILSSNTNQSPVNSKPLPCPQKRKPRKHTRKYVPKKKKINNPTIEIHPRQSRSKQGDVIEPSYQPAAPVITSNRAQTRCSFSRKPVIAVPALTPHESQTRRSRSNTIIQPSSDSVSPSSVATNALIRLGESLCALQRKEARQSRSRLRDVVEQANDVSTTAAPVNAPSGQTIPASIFCQSEVTDTKSTSEQSSSRSLTLRQQSIQTSSSNLSHVNQNLASAFAPINQNTTSTYENKRALCNRLLNPSEEEEGDDGNEIQIIEPDIQIIEEEVVVHVIDNPVMFEFPSSSSQMNFSQKSAPGSPYAIQYRQPTPTETHVHKLDNHQMQHDSNPDNNVEGGGNDYDDYDQGHDDGATDYFTLPSVQAVAGVEEKVFSEEKYDPAILSFNRPSDRTLKAAAKKLSLIYSPECYTFWSNIKIDVIKSRSDSINTGPKLPPFNCLSLFLTGNPNAGDTLRTNVILKLENDSLMKVNYDDHQLYQMALKFHEEHFKLIAYWLSCRIGVYEHGILKKYGDWKRSNQSNDLIILMEKDGDLYAPIFNL